MVEGARRGDGDVEGTPGTSLSLNKEVEMNMLNLLRGVERQELVAKTATDISFKHL